MDQHLSDDANVLNGQVYRAITDCEVEAAYEQQRQLGALIDSDDDGNNALRAVEDDDLQSQSTFRTRTDSSSIGDYESHSVTTMMMKMMTLWRFPMSVFCLQKRLSFRTIASVAH